MPKYLFLPILIFFALHGNSQNISNVALKDSGNQALKNENYLGAIKYYKLVEKDTSLIASVNFNMGIAYRKLSDFENAEHCYLKAIEYYKTKRKKGDVLNSLGLLYKNLNEYNKAIIVFKKALEYNYNSKCLINLSNTYLLKNQLDSAYYFLDIGNAGQSENIIFRNSVSFAWNLHLIEPQKAYNLIVTLKPEDNYEYLDRYSYLMGKYYYSINNATKGKEFLISGLELCSNQLVRVYLLSELNRIHEAVAIIDTLLEYSENYSTKLNLAEKQASLYDILIINYLQNKQVDSAFYYTEKSKSVALKAHLTDKGLIERVRVKSIPEIQNSLRENEVLFEYKLIDSLMLCFELTPTEFKLYTQKIEAYFFTAIYDVNEVCKEVDYPIENPMERYCNGAYYLYTIFLGNKKIENKNLVIVPDGSFVNLSFDVLLTGPGDTTDYKFMFMPYLVRKNATRYVYSASMNRTIAYKNLDILHIAPPVELAGAEALKEAIKKYSTFYDKFTKDELKMKMKKYAFLHFDTHGYIDEDNPLNSSLELGFDSLFVSEIVKEDLSNADMVFLAACNTGVGKYSKGEGSISIERGFMLAGVKTAVTAFWFASDLYAPRIISVYYKELKEGAYPEDALRKAKLAFLNASPKENELGYHPYNWATYSVVGASGIAQTANRKNSILPFIMVFLLISIPLGLFYRKRLK